MAGHSLVIHLSGSPLTPLTNALTAVNGLLRRSPVGRTAKTHPPPDDPTRLFLLASFNTIILSSLSIRFCLALGFARPSNPSFLTFCRLSPSRSQLRASRIKLLLQLPLHPAVITSSKWLVLGRVRLPLGRVRTYGWLGLSLDVQSLACAGATYLSKLGCSLVIFFFFIFLPFCTTTCDIMHT